MEDAIDDAGGGDTIYVHGGAYEAVGKRLTRRIRGRARSHRIRDGRRYVLAFNPEMLTDQRYFTPPQIELFQTSEPVS